MTDRPDLHARIAALLAEGDEPRPAVTPPAGPTFDEFRVQQELDRERARREASRRLAAEERGGPPVVLESFPTLRERLARPRVAVASRIGEFQPIGTRVLLVAPGKGGKTTLVTSLIRSLVDGDPFLGRAAVTPIAGSVALVDVEMPPRLLDEWLQAQRIQADDRVLPIPLRGIVSAFDLLDPACRRAWAAFLRSRHVSYLIVDCVRPILDVLGLDEQREAGRFLVALDALLVEAEIAEACVVHHMGHTNERARGDSRLLDWPDVSWRLLWPRAEDGSEGSARYLAAYGRDVDVPESLLAYDPATRRLTLVGGSRRAAAAEATATKLETEIEAASGIVAQVLAGAPGPLSASAIERAVLARGEHPRAAIRAALRQAVTAGLVDATPGPRQSILHRLVSECASAPSECAGALTPPPAKAESSAPVRHPPYRGGAVAQSDGPGAVDLQTAGGGGVLDQGPVKVPIDPWASLGYPPGSREAGERADARIAAKAKDPGSRKADRSTY